MCFLFLTQPTKTASLTRHFVNVTDEKGTIIVHAATAALEDSIGSQIFLALLHDEQFVAENTASMRDAWQQICFFLGEALGDSLSLPVNIQTFLQVKKQLIHILCLDNDWMEMVLRATPEEHFTDRDTTVDLAVMAMRRGTVNRCLQLTATAGSAAQAIARKTASEESYLRHPKVGNFNERTAERWREGRLTIRDLLILQPRSLLV